MKNEVSKLSEAVQRIYRQSISCEVKKKGKDHCPTIKVVITLPNGATYKAKGTNQKEARLKAAKKALVGEGFGRV